MQLNEQATEVVNLTESIRSVLKSQYHAALAMLGETIERCPDDIWLSDGHLNAFWQVAYHTLFFTHLYIQPGEKGFRPWEHHQKDVQYPDGIPGPADPASSLPLIPLPYTREEVMEYWAFCDGMIDGAVDLIDPLSPESGFSWYPIPKLEHQIVNIRHIQHGAAQLADRLRSARDIGIRWAGARRSS